MVCYKAGIRTDDNYDDDEDEDAAGDDITAMMRTKMLPVMITDGCMMCVAFCFFSIFLHGFIIVSVRTYINEEMHGAITHAWRSGSIGRSGACGSGSDTDGGLIQTGAIKQASGRLLAYRPPLASK